MEDLNKYPHPFVTVDLFIFSIINDKLSVCLSKRETPPFKDVYSLIGTFIHEDESAEGAICRLLEEKLGVTNDLVLNQLQTFTSLHRDPRGRVISISYYTIVSNPDLIKPSWAEWFNIEETSIGLKFIGKNTFLEDNLGFDHAKIINAGVKQLQEKVENSYNTFSFQFLKDKNAFTAFDLQTVINAVFLGKKNELLNRGNFKKYILNRYEELKYIEKYDKEVKNTKGRPKDVYRIIER